MSDNVIPMDASARTEQNKSRAAGRKNSIQRPKGTQDILLDDSTHWQRVEELARGLFSSAGYREIRTPVFESTELFERGVGEETDIVNKEMYTFEKSERRLTLRPEGTAGVVRAYIEQGLSRQPKPLKLYYMGPMFRYERPQAGRQRQFHQFGVELFGLDTPMADAEVILLALEFFDSLGLPNLSLEINNIGDSESREQFKNDFKAVIKPYLGELCESCQQRFETNPFRMLDCKVKSCQAIYAGDDIKKLLESEWTSEASQAHFKKLTEILDTQEVDYKRNHMLVRGLDYYTHTVFEITSTHLGAQNAVCGGGRYNNLVEDLGGEPTPAVGWALGMERLMSLVKPEEIPTADFYVVTDQHAYALQLAKAMREMGLQVEVDLSGKAFGKQLTMADKRQADYALILGESELQQDQVLVKDLASGEQVTYDLSDFLEELQGQLGGHSHPHLHVVEDDENEEDDSE